MKYLTTAIATFTAFVCAATAAFGADNRDFEINLGQFDKIKLDAPLNVVYSNLPDSTGMAVYSAPAHIAQAVRLTVSKSTLRISLDESVAGTRDLPVIHVYSDFLSEAENSADSCLTIGSIAPCARFSARQIGNGSVIVAGLRCTEVSGSLSTGNGTVVLAGKCSEARLTMLGAGTIQADRLQAGKVECKILGTGTIGCWPEEALNVKGVGSTKIYYRGNPAIRKSGSARLIALDEPDPDEAP